MKYEYDVNAEAFKRVDNRGKLLHINISEAQRIISLLNLGHSIVNIESKVKLSNPKGTVTTIKSFIKNYKNGDIIMPDDAPAPVRTFEEFNFDNSLDDLNERVSNLEREFEEFKKKSITDKIRGIFSYG